MGTWEKLACWNTAGELFAFIRGCGKEAGGLGKVAGCRGISSNKPTIIFVGICMIVGGSCRVLFTFDLVKFCCWSRLG